MNDEGSSRNDVRSRIVEVAARLLEERGPVGVTTRGVAEQAGVQAPTIYRLFGDKDGLLDAVAEHVLATFVSAKSVSVAAATAAELDPLDDLRAGWETQIRFGIANPSLFALLSDPARGLRSPAVQSGRQVLATRVHRIAAAGRLRVSEQRAGDLIQAAGTGAIFALLSMPPEQRDPGLATAMYDAVLSQILTDAPAPAPAGPLATAVTLRALAPQLDPLSAAERLLLTEWLDRAITRLQT